MKKNSSLVDSFLESALAQDGKYFDLSKFDSWLGERLKSDYFSVDRIPFSKLSQWRFDKNSGNILHCSGRFFSIEGLSVTKISKNDSKTWDQPIINQPEIGILGIITWVVDGIRYFLMQAKMEPGNLGLIQLSPTVQATESNFSRVHKGSEPAYLQYFLDRTKSKILVDQLHSEQGGRFFRKRNRNIIVEINEEIPLLSGFCWLTLGQIKNLLLRDNIINLDSRSVLSCIPGFCLDSIKSNNDLDQYFSRHFNKRIHHEFSMAILLSMQKEIPAYCSFSSVLSWFADVKTSHQLSTELIPLKNLKDWIIEDDEIRHKSGDFFSIIAIKVKTSSREVSTWDQPLIKSGGKGLLGMVCKRINGILHFLVHAKIEAGNIDIVEIAPTVSCANYLQKYASGSKLPFLDLFIDPSPEALRYNTNQSEEGGRFYQLENQNIVIEVDPDFQQSVPDDYEWLTLYQIYELHKRGFLNIDIRTLLACLGIFPE